MGGCLEIISTIPTSKVHQHTDAGVLWEEGRFAACAGLWMFLHERLSSSTLIVLWVGSCCQVGLEGAVGTKPHQKVRLGFKAVTAALGRSQRCLARFLREQGKSFPLSPGKPVYFHCILILRDCLPRPRLSHGKEKPGSVTRGETCP